MIFTSRVAIDARANIEIEADSLEEAYQKVVNEEYNIADATDEQWVDYKPISVEDESSKHMRFF